MTLNDFYQRKAPFLHRNWLKGINAWQNPAAMGNIVSSPAPKGHHSSADNDAPPRKRRRVSTPESLDIDHLIASPKTSDTRSSLRIEVLKLFHQDSKKIRTSLNGTAPRDVFTTKANCRIRVSDLSTGQPRVLHCQSQICDLTAFKNPVGPHRVVRVHLPRPFFVPEESLQVNRADDGTFGLSDSYEVVVEFEAASPGQWPPLNEVDFGLAATSPESQSDQARRLVMSSSFNQIFGKLKKPLTVALGHLPHQPCRETQYVMDVDLRWSAGFQALKRLDKGSKPCITAIDPDADPLTGDHFPHLGPDEVHGLNGHAVEDSSHEPDDEPEGEQTPSRSLRAREKNKIYNLKVLSDQARGRERKGTARGGISASEGRVTYLLPLDQPVSLDYHRCVSCGAYHQSLVQLQLHLQTYHPSFEYAFKITSQGPQFRVSSRYEPASSPSKTFQLKKTVEPFSLQTLLGGDQSWVGSRLAVYDEDIMKTPTGRASVDRMASGSPVPKPAFKTIQPQRRTGRLRKGKPLVPKTTQPLFHPISKATLKPGDEVPTTKPDSSWLIQKHRDSITDFSDVTSAEREFIWEWDGYILKQNITSSLYLPRAWLGFVRQNAQWLVSKEERMREFGKHASVLMARNVLTDEAITEAFTHIQAARARQEDPSAVGSLVKQHQTSPKSTDIRKSSSGCAVCHLPI
ncbi:hypothetical protein K4F52_008878 [Lecanicillium sp. MT-2017a]|nr:hypothetical protein K4F52_008878 [Lecanicillium sp. MT-2017a]